MPTILEAIENLPLANLSAHLEVANGSLKFSADAALDPANLLGEFGQVLKNLKLPDNPAEITKSITDGLGQLQDIAQLPDLSVLSEAATRISDLVGVLEEFAGHFTGDLTHVAEQLLSGSGGIDDVLKQMAEQLLQVLPVKTIGDAAGTLNVIQGLVGHQLETAEEVAAVVSQFVAGVSLKDLSAPGVALNDFLAKIRSAGGDVAGFEIAVAGVTTRVRAATSLILTEDLNVDTVLAELEQIDAALTVLVSSTLPGALGRLTTDLAAIDPTQLFDKLGGALKPLVDAIPSVNFDLVETIGETVGEMFMAIAATTEQEIKEKFQFLTDYLRESLLREGLAGATADMDELFTFIIGCIREIPLRRLRHELIDVLSGIEAHIRGFAGFTVPAALTEQIAKVSGAIDHLDTSAVQQRVQGLVNQIDGVIKQFPIQQIRGELEGLIGQVTDVVNQLQPLFDEVDTQLDALAQQVTEIDLSTAGQASIDLMHEIRGNVEKVAGSGDLPEPAKAAIGAGASVLKGLNLTVEISQPFHAVIDQIDPSVVLTPVKPVLAKVQETLDKVTPAALVAQLDAPFQQLQKELEKLRPENLLASVTGEFGRFADLVDKADPQARVAPLQAEFQKLIDVVRKALDPAPLFAPLHAAFAKLTDLLKQLDIAKLMSGITDRLIDVPGAMSTALKGALASRGVTGAADLPAVAAGEFKMGGFLLPITYFIGQLRRQLTKLAHDLLQKAWSVLRAPLRAIDELLQPALGVVGKIAQEVDDRLTAFDLFGPSGPAAELRAAIEDLITAQHSIRFDASVDARLGPAAAKLDLNTRMELLAAPRAAVDVQRQRFHQQATPLDLSATIQNVGALYAEIFPDSLRGDGPVDNIVELLNELLDKIDPTPLAKKLDEIGEQAMAKLKGLFTTIMQGVFDLLDQGFGLLEEFAPIGIVNRFNTNLARVIAEFNVLDPAPIEAEVRALVDAVVSVFDDFSPANLAALFSGIFDSLKNKLNALNPATLLGDLSAVDNILTEFGKLQPSVVLAPLVESTAGLTAMLKKIGAVQVGDVVVQALVNLKAQLEEIVAGLQQELQGLLDYLEGLAARGNVSVSVSASAG